MKNLFPFIMIFLFACSGGNKFKSEQYKEQHIELHKHHVDFIKSQKKLVEEEFDRLLSDLDTNADYDIVIYDWQLLNEWVNEMHSKNEIFINDVIISDSTMTLCTGMRTNNLEMTTPLHLNKVEVEVLIRSHNYIGAKNLVSELKKQVMWKIDLIEKDAEHYLKFCA